MKIVRESGMMLKYEPTNPVRKDPQPIRRDALVCVIRKSPLQTCKNLSVSKLLHQRDLCSRSEGRINVCRWLHWSLLHHISIVLYTLFHIHSVNRPRWQRCRFSEGLTAVRWHYAISWAKLWLGRGAFYKRGCSILFRLLLSAYQDPNRPIWMLFVCAWCYTMREPSGFRRQHLKCLFMKDNCVEMKTISLCVFIGNGNRLGFS